VKVAVTGGTGLVGRFITEALLAAGDEVTVLGRHAPARGAFSAEVAFRPFDLAAPAVRLDDVAALVHAGFAHVPGRYRGGEGDDPSGFVDRNLEGSRRLFAQAAAQGVGRILFLSSRAVYGPRPAGTVLTEEMALAPDTLYGEVKRDAEAALAALDVAGASLRATGVYCPGGPGRVHKWQTLFRDFAAGAEIAPRAGTEVHGADLAAAVRLLLTAPAPALAPGCSTSPTSCSTGATCSRSGPRSRARPRDCPGGPITGRSMSWTPSGCARSAGARGAGPGCAPRSTSLSDVSGHVAHRTSRVSTPE
jgi:nucleoside-diphosphate-sugar epimerase